MQATQNLVGWPKSQGEYPTLSATSVGSLISPHLHSWCLCWWLSRKAANENAGFIAISIYLRSLCLCGFEVTIEKWRSPEPRWWRGRHPHPRSLMGYRSATLPSPRDYAA
jgi:hypothetical protein